MLFATCPHDPYQQTVFYLRMLCFNSSAHLCCRPAYSIPELLRLFSDPSCLASSATLPATSEFVCWSYIEWISLAWSTTFCISALNAIALNNVVTVNVNASNVYTSSAMFQYSNTFPARAHPEGGPPFSSDFSTLFGIGDMSWFWTPNPWFLPWWPMIWCTIFSILCCKSSKFLSNPFLYIILTLSNQTFTLQQQNDVMHDSMNLFFTHINYQIRFKRFLIWIINPRKSPDLTPSSSPINPLTIRFFLQN